MKNSDIENLRNKTAEVKNTSAVFRKCIACGKIEDRTNLIRILTNYKTGEIFINPDNHTFGRSKYICKNNECLKTAVKKKKLKALSDSDLEKLAKFINC